MHSVKWETKYIMTIGTVNSRTMLRKFLEKDWSLFEK